MMSVLATFLSLALLQNVYIASISAKSIDQIIMEAAPQSSALDTFHMSPEGEVMMTVDLDIRMDIKQYMELRGEPEVTRQKRKALRNNKYRWEKCFVYYEFRGNDFDGEEKKTILDAIAEWEKYTCLQFKNATSSTRDKIVFSVGSGGCYSRLGRVGGSQEIGLSRGCVHKGVVIHEIGHAIGWIHEQARPDRDRFIRVNFNRIPSSWHSQFEKSSSRLINDFQIPYDYRSIMHYSGNAVVPRSIETLEPEFQSVIGQREGLSFRDVHLANLMYNCSQMMCPGNPSCSRYGQEAFVFKLDGECTCVCPGSDDDASPIMRCGPTHTTPTPTTTRRPTTTTSTATTTTITTTTEVPPMECMDLRDDCAQLAEDGECTMDMERMDRFCKKSCGFCDKENMCMDYDPTCPLLALGNFCDRPGFVELMEKQCRKSCKLCTAVAPCEMQRQMGLPVGADTSVAAHSCISTAILAMLVLVWTLF